MDNFLFIGTCILFGILYLWIGNRASKGLDTQEEYFLMGRKLGWLPLMITILATQVGGGTLLGAAEEAYVRGWMVIFYPLGASIGLVCLGLGFGAKLRKLNLTTIPEIFEVIYRSRNLRYIASILSIVSLFIILVGMGIASRKFFAAVGYDNPLVFGTFWMVLVIYTVMGGLKAVVHTDILQALFICAVLGLAFFWSGSGETTQVITQNPSYKEIPWVSWMLMPLLFMLIEQDMGQRCFAAKTPRTASIAALISAGCVLVCSSVAIYFGVKAAELGIQANTNGSILIAAVEALTNPVVTALFQCAILFAIISTADSLLCSISSNLACDFSNTNNVKTSQILTFGTGVIAMFMAFSFDNVVTMLMLSYELSVSALFVPVVMAVLSDSSDCRCAIGSMAMGALGFCLFRVCETPVPKEIATIGLSFLGYLTPMLKNNLQPRHASDC